MAKVQCILETAVGNLAKPSITHQAKINSEAGTQNKHFVAKICHEVRNTLVSMVDSTSTLETDTKQLKDLLNNADSTLINSDLKKKILQMLETQNSAIDSMDMCVKQQKLLTDDVLTLSELGSPQFKNNIKEICPKKIVKEAIDMVKFVLKKKNIQLNTQFFYDEALVNIDPLRMRQILLNLILNAIKFTPQNGEITITLPKPQLTTDDRSILKFSIKDNGIGMNELEKRQIFKPFQQANADISHKYGGSGLGLSIVDELVKLMDGSIELKSEEGKGSEFTVMVRCPNVLNKKPDSPLIFSAAKPILHTGLKILVAEDNIVNQKIVKQFLEMHGFNCEIANNGLDAVNLCAKHDFAMVLMDISMPKMDGIEASKLIREHEKKTGKKAVPIIALSASNLDEEYIANITACGMNDHMVKPFERQALLQLIDKYAAKASPIHANLNSNTKIAYK